MTGLAFTDPALDLADKWQRDFPLCPRPFEAIGARADLTEREVIEALQDLADRSVLARVGAAVRPNTVGSSTLAAMAVPEEYLSSVADSINAIPGVNHNYEREHTYNLWFVLTAPDSAEKEARLSMIADRFGFPLLDLPIERAYHIDLGFPLTGSHNKIRNRRTSTGPVCGTDRAILGIMENGLPFIPRPYRFLAEHSGIEEKEVLARLEKLIAGGVISRFGCILRHRRIGYRANAMAVWDVPDNQVDNIAEILADQSAVTLCYRRTRRMPEWPFNLFAMIHGHDRGIVKAQLSGIARISGLTGFSSAVLFSRRCFKQGAARYSYREKGAA